MQRNHRDAWKLVERLRDKIEHGELRPGDRLPTESEMAEEFGVSRPTVRGAVTALAAAGILVSRSQVSRIAQPEDVYDFELNPFRLVARFDGASDDEAFELRTALGDVAAVLGAIHASPEQLGAMADALVEMSSSLDSPNAFLAHYNRFHEQLAAAAANRFLERVARMLSPVIKENADKAPLPLALLAEGCRALYMSIRERRRGFACEGRESVMIGK